jgi:hypothetical protein
MSIRISAQERDALYGRITLRLNGIADIETAVEGEDWEAAQRLGEEFSALLRLVCTDLGWGERPSSAQLTLDTPPDVVRRAAGALHEIAKAERAIFEARRQEADEELGEVLQVQEACERILGELDQSAGSDPQPKSA